MSKHKSSTLTVLITAFTACFVAATAYAEQLNGEQVTALLSGKTSYAYHDFKDFDIDTYFAPDGSVISIRNGEKHTGKWRVESNGNHCVRLNDPYSGEPKKEHCRFIENNDGTYTRIKVKRKGKRIPIITYKRFADGNTL